MPAENPHPPAPPDGPSGASPPPKAPAAVPPGSSAGISDHIKPIVGEIRERVSELVRRELSLRQREEDVQQQYRLLQREAREVAQGEWAEAQERLRRRSDELDAQALELSARSGRLDELEQILALRQVKQEQSEQGLAREIERLRRQVDAFTEERAVERRRLRERIAAIRAREDELEQRIGAARSAAAQPPGAMAEREREERWRAARGEHHEVTRQAEELYARRRVLQEQQETLEQCQAQLESYEQQLRERAGALEAEAERLAALSAQVEARRAEADARLGDLDQQTAVLRRQREELLTQREQAEARDAEHRQQQLAAELELEALRRTQSEVAAGAQDLADRKRREDELERARAALARQAEVLQRALSRQHGVAPRWRLRAGVAAGVAGLLASAAWWGWERPAYQAAAELRLVGEVAAPTEVLLEHERRLQSPALVAGLLDDEAARRAWEPARLELASVGSRPVLRVSLAGSDPGAITRLVEQVAAGYQQVAASQPADAPITATERQLADQREGLARELADRRQESGQGRSRLGRLATPSQRDEVRSGVARLRSEHEELGRALADQRARLGVLMAGPAPRGAVAAGDFAVTLGQDEMYLADAKEFRASAAEYRSELAVAMLMLVDPARDVQRALDSFASVLTEQRGLKPPAVVAGVLETTAGEISAFAERLESFQQEWQSLVAAVRGPAVEENAVELLRQQRAAADAAGKIAADAEGLLAGIRTRIAELSVSSDGAARVVVVAAVLRDAQTKLASAVAALDKAAEQVELPKNFRLDALDRQLRGLRTRLEQRSLALRQQLQFEADERARQEHAQQVAALQQTVAEAEERREALLGEWTDGLDGLRRLDEEVTQRKELEADLHRCETAIAALEQQIALVEAQLAEAQGGRTVRPVLEAGPATLATVAGQHRLTHALLVGLAALLLTMLGSVSMRISNPRRRRALGHDRGPVRDRAEPQSAPQEPAPSPNAVGPETTADQPAEPGVR